MSANSITRTEYVQLAGLLAIGSRLVRQTDEVEKAILEITGEGDYGHGTDALYNEYDVDTLVGKLGVEIED